MSSGHAALSRFLSEDCAECGTPGYQRHLSTAGGCATCAAENPYPVHTPVRNVVGTVLSRAVRDAASFAFPPPRVREPVRLCYQMASGAMVHVKPGCRCK